MIESSDGVDAENVFDAAKKIRKELPGLTVGILHGRMKPAEKDAVMEAFRTGETTILVSTTVVEVGVDVPNATVMLVINAERFGLAQLHQLRGRVGRGSAQSYCIFMAGLESETVTKRMEILNRSNDGFEIAEKDFELRGPGDLLGIRQSGDAVFRLADPAFDRELMEKAGKLAAAVVGDSPSLEGENLNRVRQRLDRFMQESMRTITL
jgi:ATP-dependent DNA helicase RecG